MADEFKRGQPVEGRLFGGSHRVVRGTYWSYVGYRGRTSVHRVLESSGNSMTTLLVTDVEAMSAPPPQVPKPESAGRYAYAYGMLAEVVRHYIDHQDSVQGAFFRQTLAKTERVVSGEETPEGLF